MQPMSFEGMADRDAEAHVLGLVVVNAQMVEVMLAAALGRVLGIGWREAQILSGHLMTQGTIRVLRELAKTQTEVDGAGLTSWLKQADAAMDGRNRVIHRAWVGEGPDGEKDRRILTKKAITEPQVAGDVQAVAHALMQVAEAGAGLVGTPDGTAH